eukprot:TRINITY_DN779_c5_g1_i1.p1 TRINITY_DN779_c5_g1~~TRINITY_DN779_c5_g1_i1.p1  ORF type:complete len:404 (+),score=84.65 TRINITY_DN779_c5_g1_i1:68-1279(+)
MNVILAAMTMSADNGLARTPPMGWSTWNAFGRRFTEEVFYNATDALVSNGMRDAGYEYINVDGGWWNGSDTGVITRNESGFTTYNRQKYPHGIKNVIDYIHSKGMKYGHYTDAGTAACNHDAPMSEYYEHQDVALFVSWNIDYIKIDACSTQEDPDVLMNRWHTLLNESGRPILLSNCHNGCMTHLGPLQPWCQQYTNMWRVSVDIKSTWASMISNIGNLVGRGIYGKPGSWNDPDILEMGLGEFEYKGRESLPINQAHFSLWCVTSSPLLASVDFTKPVDPALVSVFTNKEAIAVNQQYLSNAGDRIDFGSQSGGNYSIWYKPLPDSTAAVVLLNEGTVSTVSLQIDFDKLPVLHASSSSACQVRDIWSGTTDVVHGVYKAPSIPAQSCIFVTISKCSSQEE